MGITEISDVRLDLASPPGVLTLSQAAERIGCTTPEVFALVRDQRLPATCTPRSGLVVAEADLERYVSG